MAQFNDALQRARDALGPVLASLQSNPALGTAILALVCLLLLLLVLVQARRIGRLGRRLDRLAGHFDDGTNGSTLEADLDAVDRLGRDLRGLAARTGALEAGGAGHIQHFGLVRFNAFDDTGGNQSFALALLDDGGDGLIVSSLHSRSSSRLYAKALRGGRSDMALSAEETEAVEQARRGGGSEARRALTDSRGPGGPSRGVPGIGGVTGAGGEQARAVVPPPPARTAQTSVLRQARPAASARSDEADASDEADEPMEAGFLERRLRGQPSSSAGRRSLWEDRPGS